MSVVIQFCFFLKLYQRVMSKISWNLPDRILSSRKSDVLSHLYYKIKTHGGYLPWVFKKSTILAKNPT